MHFLGNFSVLTFLAMTVATANAYIDITEPFCEDVPVFRRQTETVCATMQVMGPSPAVIDNEVVYVGDYSVDYFYQGKYDGIIFHVEWATPQDQECVASVNQEECLSCFRRNVDGEEQVAVDCRNVRNGRGRVNADYASIEMGTMFFPLRGERSRN